MNLIEKVFAEMSTDAGGNEKQAQILEQEYMDATDDQQKAIDRVFIALCGWSLKTLIEGHEATESYNPYKWVEPNKGTQSFTALSNVIVSNEL